ALHLHIAPPKAQNLALTHSGRQEEPGRWPIWFRQLPEHGEELLIRDAAKSDGRGLLGKHLPPVCSRQVQEIVIRNLPFSAGMVQGRSEKRNRSVDRGNRDLVLRALASETGERHLRKAGDRQRLKVICELVLLASEG